MIFSSCLTQAFGKFCHFGPSSYVFIVYYNYVLFANVPGKQKEATAPWVAQSLWQIRKEKTRYLPQLYDTVAGLSRGSGKKNPPGCPGGL